MGIAIGATGLSLVLVLIWMVSLSMRKQRLEQERKAREVAYRKAIEKSREQERKDRLYKAETGHIPTILFLAKEAERTNLKEALFWYDKAAKLDNINGMYGMVRISERIKEDPVVREQANFWKLAIAGLEGDLNAKFQTGKALVHGRGVEKNLPKGYGLIEQAAIQGNLEAMLYMGKWCKSSDNPKKSLAKSYHWFKVAALKGSVEGMIQLGLSYIGGYGIEKDHEKGCYWLELASEKGSTEAMYCAGDAWRGHGKAGNALAYVWLFLATHFGNEKARRLRDQVASNLGVDILVGLQSVAKPMIKKLETGSVAKHSLIKALDKVYKRNSYFPSHEFLHQKAEAEDVNLIAEEVSEASHSQKTVETTAASNVDFTHAVFESKPKT